jgi:hypothetical protein
VDFNKNKYEGALTQSAAKKLGTSLFGNQLIFYKWLIEENRTPMSYEFQNWFEFPEKNFGFRLVV